MSRSDRTAQPAVAQNTGSHGSTAPSGNTSVEAVTVHQDPAPDAPAPSPGTRQVAEDVNHPAHYNQGSIECIDAIAAALGPEGFAAYCRGSAMKYLWRAGLKGPAATDLAKAAWYINRMMEAK